MAGPGPPIPAHRATLKDVARAAGVSSSTTSRALSGEGYAEGVWRAAGDLGLRIPDDLSIVSFDDAQWMSMVTPGVTAVSQDAVALGGTAMDRMVERIEHPNADPVTVVLDSHIRPRGSTSGPRRH